MFQNQFDNYQELEFEHTVNTDGSNTTDSDSDSEYSSNNSDLNLNEFTNSINNIPQFYNVNNDNKIKK